MALFLSEREKSTPLHVLEKAIPISGWTGRIAFSTERRYLRIDRES
jgi:hypothetical protein